MTTAIFEPGTMPVCFAFFAWGGETVWPGVFGAAFVSGSSFEGKSGL